MTPFAFILAALACYRTTLFFVHDDGPFEVFKRLRKLWPKFLGCPFCVSIWMALVIEGLLAFSGITDNLAITVCSILAMSAITIILHRIFNG